MIADIDKDGSGELTNNSTNVCHLTRIHLPGTIDFNEFLQMMTAKMVGLWYSSNVIIIVS